MNFEKNKFRKIVLSDRIKDSTVKEVIEKILEINYRDCGCVAEYKEYEVEPIELYISSFGGSVYDGLALVDIIRNSNTPIHTYC